MTNRLCVLIAEAILKDNRQAGVCWECDVSMYCHHRYLSKQMEAQGEMFRQSHTFTGHNGTYFAAVICCLGHGICKSGFSAALQCQAFVLLYFLLVLRGLFHRAVAYQ